MATAVRTLSDLVAPQPQSRVATWGRDALLILAGSGLVAVLAQISIPLQPVPITGQTFGVLAIGAALGWRRGALALAAYLAEGLLGLPVFAGGASGPHVLAGPTGGYLVGFIFAAALVGFLAERGWDRSPIFTAVAMVLGNLVIYCFGVARLAMFLHINLALASKYGLQPFLIGDAIKLVLAVIVLPGIWALTGRRDRH